MAPQKKLVTVTPAEAAKRYKANHPERVRDQVLRRKYGITLETYNSMFAEQDGCCAICGRHQSQFKKALFVDHNHETGEVRGLLCFTCNRILGYAMESEEVLLSAITYLIKDNLQ